MRSASNSVRRGVSPLLAQHQQAQEMHELDQQKRKGSVNSQKQSQSNAHRDHHLQDRRLTLKRPRFTVKISYITFILICIVIVMPLTLSLLVVNSVDDMVKENIPTGQAAAAQRIGLQVYYDVFAPVLDKLVEAKTVVRRSGAASNPLRFNASTSVEYELVLDLSADDDGTQNTADEHVVFEEGSVVATCPTPVVDGFGLSTINSGAEQRKGRRYVRRHRRKDMPLLEFVSDAVAGTTLYTFTDVSAWETTTTSSVSGDSSSSTTRRRTDVASASTLCCVQWHNETQRKSNESTSSTPSTYYRSALIEVLPAVDADNTNNNTISQCRMGPATQPVVYTPNFGLYVNNKNDDDDDERENAKQDEANFIHILKTAAIEQQGGNDADQPFLMKPQRITYSQEVANGDDGGSTTHSTPDPTTTDNTTQAPPPPAELEEKEVISIKGFVVAMESKTTTKPEPMPSRRRTSSNTTAGRRRQEANASTVTQSVAPNDDDGNSDTKVTTTVETIATSRWLFGRERNITETELTEIILHSEQRDATAAIYDGSSDSVLSCVHLPKGMTEASILNDLASATRRYLDDAEAKEQTLKSCAIVHRFLEEHKTTFRKSLYSDFLDDDSKPTDAGAYYQVETTDGFMITVVRIPSNPALYSNTAAKNSKNQHNNVSAASYSNQVEWYSIHVQDQATYLTGLLQTRGKIIVTAFAIGSLTVVLLLLMMRSVLHPLRAISKAIYCCACLDLEGIEIMEASSVAEISEIQRSVSYLAIRLYHYLRFLPDRVILNNMRKNDRRSKRPISSSDDDDEDPEEKYMRGVLEESLLGHVPKYNKKKAYAAENSGSDSSLFSSSSEEDSDSDYSGEDDDEIDDEDERRQKLLSYTTQADSPEHNIVINVLYESRHATKNTAERHEEPNKSAKFVFHHRITDPVHAMLLRCCRLYLNERPGEVLVMFVQTHDGKRQLATDEDVLFAIEYFSKHGDVASLDITVRKGANRAVLPLLIALGTFFSFMSRLVLSTERMGHHDSRVQLLGLLLLSCLGMQIAQNALIALYILRRFDAVDDEFRAWHVVSSGESMFGVFFGCFNVTNLEVMACHVRLHKNFRLSAPLSPLLLQKIRKYSFLGFIVGDVVPFIIIVIETVLRESYQDPFIVASLFFSVLSVTSILIRHGIIRFIVDDVVRNNKDSIRTLSTKSLLLSRKEVSVLKTSVSGEKYLMEFLSPALIDELCELLYSHVSPIAKKFGGLVVTSNGLAITIVFNAHTVIPHHANTAMQCFMALQETVEMNVLKPFFDSERISVHVVEHWQAVLAKKATRRRGTKGSSWHDDMANSKPNISVFHHAHRFIGSIVTGEMCMGYVGTLTSQTFQHIDATHHLSNALLRMNEHYGSTLLCNELCMKSPGMADTTARRIDKLTYDESYFVRNGGSVDGDDESSVGGGGGAVEPFPTVEVFEMVICSFLQDTATASPTQQRTSSPSNRLKKSGLTSYEIHSARLCSPTDQVIECIKAFDAAIDFLFSVSSAVNIARYVKAYPMDKVACRVFAWARFFGASNELQTVRFPRVLTTLGVQRHICERPKGQKLQPLFITDSADVALQNVASKTSDRARQYRPPRSERRQKDPRYLSNSTSVLEQVLGQQHFTVTFGAVPETESSRAALKKVKEKPGTPSGGSLNSPRGSGRGFKSGSSTSPNRSNSNPSTPTGSSSFRSDATTNNNSGNAQLRRGSGNSLHSSGSTVSNNSAPASHSSPPKRHPSLPSIEL